MSYSQQKPQTTTKLITLCSREILQLKQTQSQNQNHFFKKKIANPISGFKTI